jgi:hypothetical protein
MLPHRVSYWKTTVLAGPFTILFLSLAAAQFAHSFGVLSWTVQLLFGLAALGSFMAMIGGMLCLYRDQRGAAGRPDIFFERVNRPTEKRRRGLRCVRNIFALVFEVCPQVGDIVEIRSAAEILHTLDADSALDGLPFMPEMLRFCGSRFRVYRRVDKINDMKTKTGLRRLRNTVTLEGLRCDGSGHDGCQAECQILWKDAWLQRVTIDVRSNSAPVDALPRGAAVLKGSCVGLKTKSHHSEADGSLYFCQMTELLRASAPMSWWDVRQDLRSLFYGNVGLIAFLMASLTRLFNTVQTLRGGCGYPYYPGSDLSSTPRDDLGLIPGDRVRVKSREAIAKTLDRNGRNRGLRFDREMIRFCGHRFAVRRGVSKIIGEDSGRMLTLKTPCVTLEGATATGEFLRFCPQNEYTFWREAWLQRDDSATEMNGLNVMPCSIDKRLHGMPSPSIKPAV